MHMCYLPIVVLLLSLGAAPLLAQDAKENAQPEKKEAARLNVYEATFSGMT